MSNIGIIGLGYVGLTTAVSFAEIGHTLYCYDVDSAKMKMLKEGILPIYEPEMDEYFKRNTSKNRITFTSSIKDLVESSDVLFICVGTPFNENTGELSMIYVEQAARTIASNLSLIHISEPTRPY